MPSMFTRDPASVLDYVIDWSAWLGTDTIDQSTWTVAAGIVKDSDTYDTTTATIWVSGGDVNARYALTNHVTTVGGRTDERTITVSVRER